jgi:hypothetical protein
MTSWNTYFEASDLVVTDFEDWSEGEIQYLIDKLQGTVTPSSIGSARAIQKVDLLKLGDYNTLREALVAKSVI